MASPASLLPKALVVNLATFGPLGTRLPAPGTWGSLAGLLLFLVFASRLGPLSVLGLSFAGFFLSVLFCGEAEVRLKRRDPGCIILDEVVAMPLCFVGWQYLLPTMPQWLVFAAAFALFRLYDIAKPFGIKKLQYLPGGWGVTVDDTAAALATCLTLHSSAFLWRLFH